MGLLKRIDELELTLRGASYISLEQREYLNRLKAIVEELEKYKANSQEEIRRNEDIINRLSKKVDHLEGRVENVAKKREIVDLDVRVVCELSDELDKAPIAEALRDYAKQYPRRKFSINFRGGRYDSIDSIISVFRGDKRVFRSEIENAFLAGHSAREVVPTAMDLAFFQEIELEDHLE